MIEQLWTLVLAAGSGRRLAAVTQGVPKQFWCARGGRSLLDETFSRVSALSPPARTTVVVDRRHDGYVQTAQKSWPADWLLYQPDDRGTAAGVLLALSPVLDSSPDDLVLLTPSDHAVADTQLFRNSVGVAVAAIQSGDVEAVLFGVEPSAAITDYGWIVPGSHVRRTTRPSIRRIEQFVEKPASDLASRLFKRGALWNTMVLVARARTLFGLYQTHLPHVAAIFETYRRLPSSRRKGFLTAQYEGLPRADFSRDLLAVSGSLAVCTWGPTLGWSDLGTPDRLQSWLDAMDETSSHRSRLERTTHEYASF